ncbi:MAG: ATP-dependent helicase HrpB [Pseudomonadota bacterium]
MTDGSSLLPIESALPEIFSAAQEHRRMILAAPPGAGKTSRVPLALSGLLKGYDAPNGRVLVLQPRRLAARLAAERLSKTLGEAIGQTVGLSTRIDRKISPQSRIEVMTDGVFVRRLLANPDLNGVSVVLFDEIHERSLNMDLGLALAVEVQSVFREDLTIGLMSATLDTEAMKQRFDAPVIVTEGRQFPVETRYIGRSRDRPAEQAAAAVQKALRETDGSVLAFLPGAGDIRRAAALLEGRISADIAPLYGALSPAEQDRAIRPSPRSHRKVVLATDIAESSLTIEGVSVVVDLGLVRRPKQNPNGMGTTLVTERASRASVDQRRGRAGRLGPGVCYRIWDEAETRGLTAAQKPEIFDRDLAGMCLTLAAWGEENPARLAWLDAPPAGRIKIARERLTKLGALSEAGGLTDRGRDMAELPMSPELAALIVSAQTGGERALAAEISVLLGEPGLGGPGPDIAERLARFRSDKSGRAKMFRKQAERWSGQNTAQGAAQLLLAQAWPDQIARKRASGDGYQLASGRGGVLSEDAALAKSDWLVVAELSGSARAPRITQAIAISETDVRSLYPPNIEESAVFEPESGVFRGRRIERIGAIILSEMPLPRPSDEAAKVAWLSHIQETGFVDIDLREILMAHVARLSCLHDTFGEDWHVPTIEHLENSVHEWLSPLIPSKGFAPPNAKQLASALSKRLSWSEQTSLNEYAPLTLTLPTGRRAKVDWLDARAPLVEARVQELFGTTAHPSIADGRQPITLQFLSPGGKPVATTQDLPGFWKGGYLEMAKDMRGRYPKHDWATDPSAAKPHAGLTKARLARK